MANLNFEEMGACDSAELMQVNFKNKEYRGKIETILEIMKNKGHCTMFDKYDNLIEFLNKKNKTKEQLEQLEIIETLFLETFFKKTNRIIKTLEEDVVKEFFKLLSFKEEEEFGDFIGDFNKKVNIKESVEKKIEENKKLLNKPEYGMTDEQKEYYENEYQKNYDKII